MTGQEFKTAYNYKDYPDNSCMDCIHSIWEPDPDTNEYRRFCTLGQLEVSDDGFCTQFQNP